MTDWLQILPAFAVGAALLLIPGLALAYSLGLRGLWAWSLAPAISMTMFVAASLGLPLLGLEWTLVNAGAFVAGFGGLVFVLFRFVLRTRFVSTSSKTLQAKRATIAAWATSGSILTVWIILGLGAPDGISQTFDNVFHLNAIAFIESTGNASPLAIGALTAPDSGGGFYPVAWHALVALVEQATGSGVALALNGFNIAASVIIWPLGMLLLVRQLVGRSTVAMLLTGIFSAAFPAFPINMLHFGVLYPYFLGVALVPVALAVLLQLLNLTRDEPIGSKPAIAVLLLGLLPGLALTHPVAMMTVLAISVPLVLTSFVAGWAHLRNSTRLWRIVGLAAYGLVGYQMLYRLRPGVIWAPPTSTTTALWRTVSLQLGGYGLPLVLAALTLIGIIFALAGKHRVGIAMVGMWAVIAGLHFLTGGVSVPLLRGITGVWYGDTPRLAAIMPIIVIPLAVLGAERLFTTFKGRTTAAAAPALVGAGMVLLLLLTQLGAGYPSLIERMRSGYLTESNSALLSIDERALLERLDREVGEDEMVVGSPWTGTSLALAFAGRDVLMPHILMTLEGDRALIMDRLKFADTDPAVCDAVNDLNARWFLDFGKQEVHGAEHSFAGLEGIAATDVVELVDQEGAARLYRVTACD